MTDQQMLHTAQALTVLGLGLIGLGRFLTTQNRKAA